MRKQEQSLSLPSYGVLVESHVHGPEFRTRLHTHPYHSLLYVVSGAGQCAVGKKVYKLIANTAIVLKADQPHQFIDQPRKAMTIFVVYFDRALAKANKQLVDPLLSEPKILTVPPHRAQRIRRTLRQMLHEQDSKLVKFDLALQQYLSSILLRLYRLAVESKKSVGIDIKAGSKERVEQVLDYVAEQFYEPQSLSDAARMAKLSQRQFSNICRKLIGRSFIKYVNMLRTRKAAELLRNTNMPVTAIAFGVGFEELSTFYRAFKRLHKIPPRTFRERQKGK